MQNFVAFSEYMNFIIITSIGAVFSACFMFRVFKTDSVLFQLKKCIWWRIASILSSLTCVLLENGLNCLLLLYKVRDTQLCVCTTIFLTLARFEIKVADRSTLCEEIQSKNRKGAAAEKKVKPKPSNNLP